MRILIADDEPVSRSMLQALLMKVGVRRDLRRGWRQCIGKAAGRGRPATGPARLEMPGQNGVDVCRGLRKLRPDPYTYILLLTAKDAKESVVEGLESGADDYLTKPFNLQELKARIRVGTARARFGRQTGTSPGSHALQSHARHAHGRLEPRSHPRNAGTGNRGAPGAKAFRSAC